MKSNARSLESSSPRVTVEEEVEALLRQLPPHEEQIVRLRFGIGKRKHEIVDVAARLSLAPAAVHRIEQSTLRKLRLEAVEEELHEYPEAG
jgi:DNA-directed RNA polymerase sigma subunit (sigma70/sigma32)